MKKLTFCWCVSAEQYRYVQQKYVVVSITLDSLSNMGSLQNSEFCLVRVTQSLQKLNADRLPDE
jgi:hypothetical protein